MTRLCVVVYYVVFVKLRVLPLQGLHLGGLCQSGGHGGNLPTGAPEDEPDAFMHAGGVRLGCLAPLHSESLN